MVKSYPGFGLIFLILFFVVIGIWMFINPLLNGIHKLNYGGLLFTAIGVSLTFTLKKITVWKEGIQIKQIVTGKEINISINQILQINITEDNRDFFEIYFSGRRRHPSRIKILFRDKDTPELILRLNLNTFYNPIKDFMRENYAELINEQEYEQDI